MMIINTLNTIDNFDKNLKALIINENGDTFPFYDDDYKIDENGRHIEHYEILSEAVIEYLNDENLINDCKDYLYTAFELIKEVVNHNYIVIYDTTNYNNYHKGKNHDGNIFLPSTPNELSYNQKQVLISLYKEMPINNNIKYLEDEKTNYVLYDSLNCGYLNEDRNWIYLGDFNYLLDEVAKSINKVGNVK